ncbi:MAG: rhodanese-like domain-containing protein, partial [Planctomycetota bacterium]
MNENRLYSSRRATILAAFATAVLVGCQPNVSERDLDPADTPDIIELVERPRTVLIDARIPSKYTAGHIPGATNLNIVNDDGFSGDEFGEVAPVEVHVCDV